MISAGIAPTVAATMRTIDMRAFWQTAGLRATGAAIAAADPVPRVACRGT